MRTQWFYFSKISSVFLMSSSSPEPCVLCLFPNSQGKCSPPPTPQHKLWVPVNNPLLSGALTTTPPHPAYLQSSLPYPAWPQDTGLLCHPGGPCTGARVTGPHLWPSAHTSCFSQSTSAALHCALTFQTLFPPPSFPSSPITNVYSRNLLS